ncbi:hypothetical protein FB45DRAFT_1021860 [Roridomyces roridus]|uniref:SET domain-containing protein n=1 Tax=Roridomyces roridus TaxID=1738132 RepID=A0AAD7C6U7_9AGAR|nr:hypothetical protein FB45DRAFT_1021860 [Roridomyces roridus]
MNHSFLNGPKAKAPALASSATPVAVPSIGTTKYDLDKMPRIDCGEFPIGKQKNIGELRYAGFSAQADAIAELPEGYEAELAFFLRVVQAKGMIVQTTVPFVNAVLGEPTTECIFHPGSKEVLMGLPGFPQAMVKRIGKKSPVVVKEASGMGLGVFATRGIKAGELILSERPLLVVGHSLPTPVPLSWTRAQTAQCSLDQREKILAVAVDRMSDEDKAAYLCRGLCGVCKMISRFNHSCSPNVTAKWNMITFSFHVFAVRNIAADEELTLQYIPIELSTAERNEQLKPYDFVCTCRSCKDPESDARRAELNRRCPPTIIIPAWLTRKSSLADSHILNECRQQMDILEREGMESVVRCFNVSAAGFLVCLAMGDADRASAWAGRLARIRWVQEVPKDIDSFLDPKSRAYKDGDSEEGLDVMTREFAAMGLQEPPSLEELMSGLLV